MRNHSVKILEAARVYLGLKQTEVAEITGLTTQTISNAESGKSGASERTVRRLREIYEGKGIVFTANGFEYQPYKTSIFENFLDVLNDAEQILKKGDELYLHCADERRNSDEVTKRFQSLRDKGIRIRMICEEGNHVITGDKKDYRFIESELFAASQVEVIYKDKYIFHFRDEGKDIFVVTKNKSKAETSAKQFEYIWKKAKKYGE